MKKWYRIQSNCELHKNAISTSNNPNYKVNGNGLWEQNKAYFQFFSYFTAFIWNLIHLFMRLLSALVGWDMLTFCITGLYPEYIREMFPESHGSMKFLPSLSIKCLELGKRLLHFHSHKVWNSKSFPRPIPWCMPYFLPTATSNWREKW